MQSPKQVLSGIQSHLSKAANDLAAAQQTNEEAARAVNDLGKEIERHSLALSALLLMHSDNLPTEWTFIQKKRLDRLRAQTHKVEEVRALLPPLKARISELEHACQNHEKRVLEAFNAQEESKTLKASLQAAQDHLEKTRALFEVIEPECREKLTQYVNDPFFNHLLDSQFGGEAYHANPVSRRLDQWLARKLDYRSQKENFDMLGAMRVAVNARRDAAEKAFTDAKDQHDSAWAQASQSDVRWMDDLRQLEGLRQELADKERLLTSLEGEIKALETGQDESTRQQASRIASTLLSNTQINLSDLVSRTETALDDEHFNTLERLWLSQPELEGTLAQSRQTLSQAERVYQRAKRLEQEFHRRNLDDQDYRYDNFDLSSVLTGYLLGRSSDREALDRIEDARTHVPRRSSSNDDSSFGSGGFGSSGGFGGGGFKTTDSF